MRCTRCGNENPDQNRFCGMCGASLLSTSEVTAAQSQRVTTAVTTAAAASAAPKPQIAEPPLEPPRTNAPADDRPSISGPSFLGLNDPPERTHASLSLDPHSAPSSVDYLLDDEEHHKSSGGAGKFLLILIALALAVGFGYFRWRDHGFGWLGAPGKPSATKPVTDMNTATPGPNSSATSATQPATPPATTPTTPDSSSGAGTSAANPAIAAPTSGAPASPTSDSSKPADTAAPTADNSKTIAAPKQASGNDTTASPNAPDQPKPTPAPVTKPRAATRPAPPVDPVAEAQRYLYGRGVPQDCDRGMRLLKPVADRANPKAMIEMGALYSAGLCTPHDLPTAYRWFAMALRQDPNNDAVQADLQKLWGEMTQPERQLAIKLTQ